jgi:hypothetical protein
LNIHCDQQKLKKLVCELSRPHDENCELETEFSDFKLTPTKFANSLERLRTNSGIMTQQGDKFMLPSCSKSSASTVDHWTETSISEHIKSAGRISSCAINECKSCNNCSCLSRLHDLYTQISHQLDHLQVQLSNDGTKIQNQSYDSATLPSVVHMNVTLEDNIKEIRKSATFILDNYRLKLDVVKEAFGLSTIRIWIGNEACFVGSDSQGYMPLQFSPLKTYNVTGH